MSSATKVLHRSRSQRQVAGVCGGLGEFFGIDPTVIRLLFVFGVIFGYGFLMIIYLVMFIVVPEEPQIPATPVAPVTVEPKEDSGDLGNMVQESPSQ